MPHEEHECRPLDPIDVLKRKLEHVQSMLLEVNEKLDFVEVRLRAIQHQGSLIMATQKQVEDQIARINLATTQQAAGLQKQADLLQNISDDIDRLIVAVKSQGVSDATIADLQAAADRVQAQSDLLDSQATFSDSVAKKADDVVPLPPVTVP